jgi:hypothetical protein
MVKNRNTSVNTGIVQVVNRLSKIFLNNFTSIVEPEPQYFAGAGAVTGCGSGSDFSGSNADVQYRYFV